MKPEYKASIIVLTYKKFDRLKNNINSILEQTYSNYEVLICDDGSPNFDKEMIESLYKDTGAEQKFRIIARKTNVGTVKNYNNAINEASGEIIVPLSQDDVFFDKNTLEEIVGVFQDEEKNICCASRINEKTKLSLPSPGDKEVLLNYNKQKMWLRLACKNFIYGAVLYFRKSFITKMGLFDEKYRLLEDYPFVLKVTEEGERIYFLNRPTIIYGCDGVSNSYSESFINDEIYLHKEICKRAPLMLHSRLSQAYMKYQYLHWKKYEKMINGILKYSNNQIDAFIIATKIKARINNEDLEECRFRYLWELEQTKLTKRELH